MDTVDAICKEKIAAIARARKKTRYNREDNVPSQIEEGLYLGSLGAANNEAVLKSLKITHILTVSYLLPVAFPSEFVYKTIKVADKESVDILQYFEECIEFIEEAKRAGDGVLVHCFVGKSRSATIVVAYLMKKHGVSASKALELVRSKRPVASPNSGFLRQLDNFEKTLQMTAISSRHAESLASIEFLMRRHYNKINQSIVSSGEKVFEGINALGVQVEEIVTYYQEARQRIDDRKGEGQASGRGAERAQGSSSGAGRGVVRRPPTSARGAARGRGRSAFEKLLGDEGSRQ